MALRITGLGEEIAAVTGLPWQINLEEWPEDPALAEKRGISRHIVRLVRSTDDPDSEVYAVKETVSEFANREYKALRELAHLGAPSVQAIAVIEGRTDKGNEELPCALVTRFLKEDEAKGIPRETNFWNRAFVSGSLPNGSMAHVFLS